MLSRPRTAPLVLGLALLAGLAAPGGPAAAAPAAPTTPQLVAVRAASHDGFDRVVWEIRGGLPATRVVQKVPQLTADGSGAPIRRVAGVEHPAARRCTTRSGMARGPRRTPTPRPAGWSPG